MGLYDGYQLANSRLTKPYQGSTLNELIKVSDVFQERYDAAELGMGALGDMIKNAKTLGQDEPLFKQRAQEYKNKLEDWSKRQDLENLPKDIMKAGRQFATEYQNFSQNLAKAQAYQDDLEKAVDAKRISRQRADDLLAVSSASYKGLKYDPSTGAYKNQFQGIGAANEVDDAEWVKKVAGDIAASKSGSLVEGPAGDYFIKRGSSIERITPDQIQSAVNAAYELDPEIQADYAQRAQIEGFKTASRIKLEDLDPTIQQKVKESGLSLEEYVAQGAFQKQRGALSQLANKYAYIAKTSSFEYDGTTVEGQVKAAKLSKDVDEIPFLIPDADMKLSDKMKDRSKLEDGAKQDQQNIDRISSILSSPDKIESLHPDEVADYRRQLQASRSAKLAKESIISGAEETVAKRMGYTNAAELLKKNEVNATSYLQPGSKVKNLFNGQDRTVANVKANGEAYLGIQQYKITYTDGTSELRNEKPAVNPQGNKAKEGTVADFRAEVRKEIKTNAENYAFKPVAINLTKAESDGLKTMIQSSPSSVEFYKPGSTTPVGSKKAPEDFEIGSLKVMKDNGSFYINVMELKKGKPTGDTYNMRITPGSNVGPVVANRLMKHSNKNPDALAAASILSGGNWSGTLNEMQNNEKIPIATNAGTVIGFVERKGYTSGSNASRYIIYDANGKDLSLSIPESIRGNVGTISDWIDKTLLQVEVQENKK